MAIQNIPTVNTFWKARKTPHISHTPLQEAHKVCERSPLKKHCNQVSFTPVPGKIMEKPVLEGIEKHLGDNSVIGHSQYGFMRGNSCLLNLILSYNRVIYLGDLRESVDSIFSDFSKAFETVSHWILLD